MLHLIKLVLDRADNLKSRCFSEAQVHRVLYLVGLGLSEEERDQEGGFTMLAMEAGILEAMEKLTGSQRVVSHKELLAWTIKKMRQLGGLEVASVKMEVTEEEEDGDEAKMKRAQVIAIVLIINEQPLPH